MMSPPYPPSLVRDDDSLSSPKARRKNVIVSRRNTAFTAAVVRNDATHM